MNVRVLDDKTLAASFDETHLEDRSCFELIIVRLFFPETCQYYQDRQHHHRPHHHHSQTTTLTRGSSPQYISYLQLILTRLMSWPWWLPSRLLVLLRVAHPPCQWLWMDSCHQTLPGGRWIQSPGEGWIGKVTNQPSSRLFMMGKKIRNEIHWHVKGFLFSHQWEGALMFLGRMARFGNPPSFCDLLWMVWLRHGAGLFSVFNVSKIWCGWQCFWIQPVSRVHLQIKFWISLWLVLCFGLAFGDWTWQTHCFKENITFIRFSQGLVLSLSRRSLIPFPQWLCHNNQWAMLLFFWACER